MADVIGFIGLGRMGSVMAERLAGAGWTLQVHDVDTGAAERLVGLGDVRSNPRHVRWPSAPTSWC